MTKPFDVDHLIDRVTQIVQRSQVYQTKLNAKIGRDFSDRLLPREMPTEPGYRALFFSRPKEDGGGDLFDWTRADDGSYLFTVGDIMGKGLQAKFYAFSFLSYIRSTIHAMLKTTVSPAVLMKRVNEMLIQDRSSRRRSPRLLLMRWEPATNRVVYANAGHCRPILATPDGPGMVEYSDLILGLDPQHGVRGPLVHLPPGSALLCYTDGLNEQVMRTGAMFGEAGVAIGAQAALETADARPHAALVAAAPLSEKPHFDDDVLVFWLQREAEAARRAPRVARATRAAGSSSSVHVRRRVVRREVQEAERGLGEALVHPVQRVADLGGESPQGRAGCRAIPSRPSRAS